MPPPPAPFRIVHSGDPAARARQHAVEGRAAALEAVQGALQALVVAAAVCEQVGELLLAPPGLRDLLAKHADHAAMTAKSGAELLRRAQEDGLL